VKPNPLLSIDDYATLCSDFLLEKPVQSFSVRVGPRLVKDFRTCSPTTMSRISGFFKLVNFS